MKIGPLDTKPAAPPPASERKTPSTTERSRTEPSAQVQLSTTASALSADGTDPTFDTAKVEKIAGAIRDGKFKVNPEAIADKLIANSQELLSRKPN
jgi:negative regulator of flagellin synthesis FlgM